MLLKIVWVPTRNTNRRHMTGDHHGRAAGRATLLVRAMDGILGTHRFVLTARTEVTDLILIFSERHLRSVMAQYARHYNGRRPPRQLQLPRPDHPVADLSQERVKRRPVLGGPQRIRADRLKTRSRLPAQFWRPTGSDAHESGSCRQSQRIAVAELPLGLGQSGCDGFTGGKKLVERDHQRGCLGVGDRHD